MRARGIFAAFGGGTCYAARRWNAVSRDVRLQALGLESGIEREMKRWAN